MRKEPYTFVEASEELHKALCQLAEAAGLYKFLSWLNAKLTKEGNR